MNTNQYLIETVSLDYVTSQDGKKINSNNHWINGIKPLDYDSQITKFDTKNWIDYFHTNYNKIVLDKEDLSWMFDAFLIGRHTQLFSEIYKEDLDNLIEKYKNITSQIFDGRKFFVRTDKVSLKYGYYKEGPYTNLNDIIVSMVTTIDAHKCFHQNDQDCCIYLLPWIETMHPEKEFRIFVYNNSITAISQQHIYDTNNWLQNKNNTEIEEIICKILSYFTNNIIKFSDYPHYVIDLALIDNDEKPYFIEPNVFGKEYASGSSLFHWIDDYNTLYGLNKIVFRYVK